MPINITRAQNRNIDNLEGFAGDNIVDFNEVSTILEKYAAMLEENIAKYADRKGITASGDLLSSMKGEITKKNGVETYRLRMLSYYDYPNEGVKGVDSSKNAPNSPYQYKTYGMPKSAKNSLKEYILSGKSKIESVKKDVALGIGLERKGLSNINKKSLIDKQVDTMAYMIKKYGIKATNYFNLAFEETFRDFEVEITKAIGDDIVITFESINKK